VYILSAPVYGKHLSRVGDVFFQGFADGSPQIEWGIGSTDDYDCGRIEEIIHFRLWGMFIHSSSPQLFVNAVYIQKQRFHVK